MAWKNNRPENWENPYLKTEKALGTEVKFNEYPEFAIFEAGADAILEALLDRGWFDMGADDTLEINGAYNEPVKFTAGYFGKLALIPEREVKNEQ